MSHRYIATLTSLVVTIIALGQGVWSPRTGLGAQSIPRWATADMEINGKGYIVGGYGNGTDLTQVWAYDPSTDSWQSKTAIPGARRIASGFSINGKGYVACGLQGSSQQLSDLKEYDPISNSWSNKAALPAPGRYGSASFVINDIGYIACGNLGSSTGPYTSQLWAYDPSTNTWSSRAPLPDQARYGCRAIVVDNKAYIIGGFRTNQTHTNEVWEYDPAIDQWAQKNPFPGAPRHYESAWSVFNTGVICSGNVGQGNTTNDCWYYNRTIDQWYPLASYPGLGTWTGTAFSVNDRIFAGLGQTSGNSAGDLWELTETTLSIRPKKDQESLGIWPNPASSGEMITIQVPSHSGIGEIVLTDLLGTVLHREKVDLDHSNAITLPELSVGGYLISTSTEDGRIIRATLIISE